MHLISITNLRDDAAQYPDAERAIRNWFKTVEQAQWQNLEEVRQSFKDAEAVGNFTVFNIKGNNYRLIVGVDYERQIVYYKYFLTEKIPMRTGGLTTVDEAKAIWAYLKTVPAIHKQNLPQPAPKIPVAAKAGEKVYFKYGCNGCHGAAGMGLCDLTKNKPHFATDAELEAFIRNPQSKVADSRMPIWQNVIGNDEMKDLVEHVRTLDKP